MVARKLDKVGHNQGVDPFLLSVNIEDTEPQFNVIRTCERPLLFR